jgi:ABC-type glycerol-3-phosphate transport system substrate-binding protein
MLKKTGRIGIVLCALMIVAVLISVTGCGDRNQQGAASGLKGMNIVFGRWHNAYDVNTYEPRNEGEEKELEWRKKIQADYGFHMVIEELAGWDDYFPIVTTNLVAGNKRVQVYELGGEWAMTLYKQGLLYPISDSKYKLNNTVPVAGQRTAYNAMIAEMFTFGGKQYAGSVGIGGDSWQGNFVFWNKRLFREAGLDPELPYNMQRDGTWTYENFFNIARQTTRDINNDGSIDIYGLPCDDVREVLYGLVYGNNANFVTIDSSGKFQNATNTPEFLEAIQFYVRMMEANVMKPRPPGDDVAWDWDFTEFFDGRTAMIIAPEWRKGQMPEMADDYGCVLPPKGPRATDYRMSLTENVFVVPAFFSPEEVDAILQAFDLWNVPMDTDWKSGQYWAFRDRRAVDETMELTKNARNVTYRNFTLIPGYTVEEIGIPLRTFRGNPAQLIEQAAPRWNALIADANR